jgi:hypothetical protein
MVKRLRVMEKKLTNSGPLRESVDKHSIYTIKMAYLEEGETPSHRWYGWVTA